MLASYSSSGTYIYTHSFKEYIYMLLQNNRKDSYSIIKLTHLVQKQRATLCCLFKEGGRWLFFFKNRQQLVDGIIYYYNWIIYRKR